MCNILRQAFGWPTVKCRYKMTMNEGDRGRASLLKRDVKHLTKYNKIAKRHYTCDARNIREYVNRHEAELIPISRKQQQSANVWMLEAIMASHHHHHRHESLNKHNDEHQTMNMLFLLCHFEFIINVALSRKRKHRFGSCEEHRTEREKNHPDSDKAEKCLVVEKAHQQC